MKRSWVTRIAQMRSRPTDATFIRPKNLGLMQTEYGLPFVGLLSLYGALGNVEEVATFWEKQDQLFTRHISKSLCCKT
jgi:hypothetical protein